MRDKLLKMRESHLLAIKYITARMDALDEGQTKYTGSPCRNGHTSGLRYVKTDGCVECLHTRDERRESNQHRIQHSPGVHRHSISRIAR